MSELVLKDTADGSLTVFSSRFNQHYHSIFGADTESAHVFIQLGLAFAANLWKEIRVVEMGFGTGKNALLTQKWSEFNTHHVSYLGLEAYPIPYKTYTQLPQETQLLHELEWNKKEQLNPYFEFQKVEADLLTFQTSSRFNLVYYDAFAPESQPELWTQACFEKVASFLVPGAVLVTYCSKGYVQRNLKAAGFNVEKHPGPPRKREVIRAIFEK